MLPGSTHYIVHYYFETPEQVAKYFRGEEVEGVSDTLRDEEIIVEINGNVEELLNSWIEKKQYTLIKWEKIKAENIDCPPELKLP